MLLACSQCQFWKIISDSPARGECHRYAPKPIIKEKAQASGPIQLLVIWPITYGDNICGDGLAKGTPPRPIGVARGIPG